MPDDAIPPAPAAEYPPPLDLTIPMPGHPSLVRFGPHFEWKRHEADGVVKLVLAFATGTPVGIVWRTLEPEESRKLLEWQLASAGVGND